MIYSLIADSVLIIHLLYLLFCVLGEIIIIVGGFLKLPFIRNIKFRIIHLISVVIVAIESIVNLNCPLTNLEYKLRVLAGQDVESEITFVGQIIRRFMFYDFPDIFFKILYIGFCLIIILTFILYPPKKKSSIID